MYQIRCNPLLRIKPHEALYISNFTAFQHYFNVLLRGLGEMDEMLNNSKDQEFKNQKKIPTEFELATPGLESRAVIHTPTPKHQSSRLRPRTGNSKEKTGLSLSF